MSAPIATLNRRAFLTSVSALTLTAISTRAGLASASPFSHADVVARARALAKRPYQERSSVPQDWLELSYEQYLTRWFRSRDALWSKTDSSYNVDFFLPGLYFPRPVQIHEVNAGTSRSVPFDLGLFDATDQAPELSQDDSLGYSGFRLRTEQMEPQHKTEFCVFQGASYFRAIAPGNTYGLSARGLALKTADPEGEEFPEFVAFWLETPTALQQNIIVHALMDSPSVSGAYRFDITPGRAPGAPCVMEVEATLFARKTLSHMGLAPLTSMFLFDSTNRHAFDDFRPAVHDSDGLLIHNGNGEILWRPLANPSRLQVSSFVDQNPRGFGLMQRSDKLSDFNDLEAHYHERPSLWVEPKGDWGRGAVTLVEIPSDKEIYDNTVAYWRPEEPTAKGAQVDLAYRLTWGNAAAVIPRPGAANPADTEQPMGPVDVAQVVNTSAGAKVFGESGRLFVVEFEAHPLLEHDPDSYDIELSSPQLALRPAVVQRNPETGGLRLGFSFDPGALPHVELRAQLHREGSAVTEVWLYRWTT